MIVEKFSSFNHQNILTHPLTIKNVFFFCKPMVSTVSRVFSTLYIYKLLNTYYMTTFSSY